MKLSAAQFRLKRTVALLAATALFPLAASAGTLHHVQSSHIAATPASVQTPDTLVAALAYSDALNSQQQLQASLNASLREQISEMTQQATLVRKAYHQLNSDLASGDERAIAESQARLEAQQEAFLNTQKHVRANLLKLREVKNSGETIIN
ncbi:MAG: hypothetical protein KGJ83_02975 [Betaproteobacteria bacterium]|nr:hypothetical protein [Betaproteobacteria bacterium]MDE2211666.1 hypothetical protein [Betaproteobacteria bacterium]